MRLRTELRRGLPERHPAHDFIAEVGGDVMKQALGDLFRSDRWARPLDGYDRSTGNNDLPSVTVDVVTDIPPLVTDKNCTFWIGFLDS